MPTWLNMVKGVVDSEGLHVNISRLTLQKTEILRVNEKHFVKDHVKICGEVVGFSIEFYVVKSVDKPCDAWISLEENCARQLELPGDRNRSMRPWTAWPARRRLIFVRSLAKSACHVFDYRTPS
mmetsp:Transcript_81886/g.208112  ORF Transcript_81886/g.208112 Transcript_81886/m.208112 type:complete len:124 (+) Transcript_81886:823-1194(+)